MIIKIENVNINLTDYKLDHLSNKIPIIFLHGFSGSLNDWKFLDNKLNDRFFKIGIDLPGHGLSDSPKDLYNYSSDFLNKMILEVMNHFKIRKAIICGYSMGGRVAINFAVSFPQNVLGLILESSSTGLTNEYEKLERIKNDKVLSEKIIKNGIDWFVNYWLNIPLFDTLKKVDPTLLKKYKEEKLKNNSFGLANSLLGFGTGTMNIDENDISKFEFPIQLITGSLDNKFTNINIELCRKLRNGNHQIIKNTGHNTHFENPIKYIGIVNNFLKNFFNIVVRIK